MIRGADKPNLPSSILSYGPFRTPCRELPRLRATVLPASPSARNQPQQRVFVFRLHQSCPRSASRTRYLWSIYARHRESSSALSRITSACITYSKSSITVIAFHTHNHGATYVVRQRHTAHFQDGSLGRTALLEEFDNRETFLDAGRIARKVSYETNERHDCTYTSATGPSPDIRAFRPFFS